MSKALLLMLVVIAALLLAAGKWIADGLSRFRPA